MKIFITGSTGFLGTALSHALVARGDHVVALSRNADRARRSLPAGCDVVEGDPTDPRAPWATSLSGCDAAVNLCGEPLARRWSARTKLAMVASRVGATRNLVRSIALLRQKGDATSTHVLLSGSAIGYYGDGGENELDEGSPAGHDLLARLCVEWEQAASDAERHAVRVVSIRTGLVLGPRGGVLAAMRLPFRMFIGGPVGTGRQWASWIALDDWVGLCLRALDQDEVTGPLNATSPNPVRMSELCQAFGAALHRPSWLRVPSVALRLKLGEGAASVVMSQRVLPRAALRAGYRYRFEDVGAAMQAAVSAPRQSSTRPRSIS